MIVCDTQNKLKSCTNCKVQLLTSYESAEPHLHCPITPTELHGVQAD